MDIKARHLYNLGELKQSKITVFAKKYALEQGRKTFLDYFVPKKSAFMHLLAMPSLGGRPRGAA